MRQQKYVNKMKRFIAGMLVTVTALNPLLESSSYAVQALAAEKNSVAQQEGQLITVKLNEMNNIGSITEKEVVVGNEYGILPTPVWEGYIFEGWFTEKNEGECITQTSIVQAEVTELFAHWKPIEIRVDLYDFSGYELSNDSITVVYGHTFSDLPVLRREGYIFEGWFTSFDGGSEINRQSQVTFTSPMALYARWSGKKIEIDFDGEGDLVYPSPIIVELGETYGSLPVMEREGYTFSGWFFDEVGTTPIAVSTVVTNQENHTLYAGWEQQGTKVTFDACGGTCDTSRISVRVDEPYGKLPVPSYTGHVFLGWYDGTGENAQRITSETIVPIAIPETLYARWEANKYTITLVPLMKEMDISSIEVTYGGTYENLPRLSKTNYSFLGWATLSSEGNLVKNTDIVKITTDRALYAQWEGNRHIITFDAVGGETSLEEKEVIYGTTYGTLPKPTKNGYVFDGWFLERSGEEITSTDTVSITEDQTLYAQWTPKQPDITLDANGGQMVYNGERLETCVLNKEYGEVYGELPKVWRDGYKFLGWYTSKKEGEEITRLSTVNFTSNAVLYARWEGKEYSVRFDAKGGIVNPKSINVITGEAYGDLPVPERKHYVFKGWYTSLEDGSKISSTTKSKLTGNQTLYALYEGEKIQITYDANGGKCSRKSNNVTYGETYGDLPTASRPGYIFTGWYTQGGTFIEADDIVKLEEDSVLEARWRSTTYTIKFDPNGGTTSYRQMQVRYGNSYGSLPNASRAGYSFKGWYTKSSGGTRISSASTVEVTSDKTLYAQWEANYYEVTFDMNGGTATEKEKTVTYGKIYGTLPTPTRKGYLFAGWYTEDRYGYKVTASSYVAIAENHTLHAMWTSEIYVVTLNANGGSITGTEIAVPVGYSYGSFPKPQRTGYDFTGWYTMPNGGEYVSLVSSRKTLYAHWTGKRYTVYFDENGGELWQESKTVTYKGKYNSLPKPTKEGMEFAGWYTARTGGTKVTETTTMNKLSDHTLYARWKNISSTLSYAANGGKEITTTKKITAGETYGTLSTPTRKGYTFLGWYTDPKGGVEITSDTIVTTLENQRVYAHWEPMKIVVRFASNGGRIVVDGYKEAIGEFIYTYGQKYGEFPVPEQVGYEFLGWYTKTTGGTEVLENQVCNETSKVTFYAHWRGVENKVRFDANGGEDIEKEITVTYGGKYGELPTPEREGYTFAGWYDKKTGGKKITQATEVTILSKQTLYASWTVKKYTLTLDGNGGGYSVKNKKGESKWVTRRTMSVPYGCNYVGDKTRFGFFSRSGYYFKGFFTEPEGGTQISVDTEFLHATNQTIYAQWEPLKVNVLFETGNADDIYRCDKIIYGDTYGELSVLEREGFVFNGWGFSAKKPVDEKTVITSSKAHSVYAQWTAKEYTLTYDANGGIMEEKSMPIFYGKRLGSLERPKREGYTFVGWYTKREGGYEVDASHIVKTAENMTIYARWKRQTNRIIMSYFGKGGKCTKGSKIIYRGNAYGAFTGAVKSGYDFTGWYKDTYTKEMVTESDIVTETDDISVYAGWKAGEYNVFFDSQGGSVDVSLKTVQYNEKYGELPLPTREYYIFDGWYTSDDEEKIVEKSTVKITDTTVLYAHWTPISYKVNFDANGGTVSIGNKTVSFEQEYGELPTPVYTGMKFIGWYTEREGGYKVSKQTEVRIPDSHTLYAHWEGSMTNVCFDANGGICECTEKVIVTGTEIGELPTAERRGYKLKGWYTLADGGEKVRQTSIIQEETITLYAQWEALDVVVTFNAQGGTVITDEKRVTFGETYGTLPIASLPGYQFIGWYLDEGGQTKIESDSYVDTEKDHSLFAHYVKREETPQEELQNFHFGEEGVNPASGNISFSVTDMIINIPGLEQELIRTYNSKDRTSKSFGLGWTFNFEARCELYGDGAIIYLPDGSVNVFDLTEDGYKGKNSRAKLQVNADETAELIQKDQMKYGFQADGMLAYIEDRNGNRTTVSYTDGLISELQDSVGRTYTIVTDVNGRITEITNPLGDKVTYAYNEDNLLIYATNLLGGVTTYEYDSEGYLVRIIDPNEKIVQEFDYGDFASFGGAEVSKSMDAYGSIKEYSYYEDKNYTVVTDESGREWKYWYDSNMNVTAVQNPDGSMIKTEYVSYEDGSLYADVKLTTDEYGNRTKYEYDENGNVTKISYCDGGIETFLYDKWNNLVMQKSETGEYTYFCYDEDGINLLKEIQKTDGAEIKITSSNAHEVLSKISNKNKNYIVVEYDYYTNDEAKKKFGCDLSGLLESETNAEGESLVYTYDEYGNTATETDAAGNKKQFVYDMLGNKLSETTPNGDEFKWSYAPNGYAIREYYPDGGVVVSQYDLAGHLIQTVPQELYEKEKDYGNLYKGEKGTFYEYYPSGRLEKVTDVLGNQIRYTYDCNGNLISEEVEGAEVYSYKYDNRDRLIKQWYQETKEQPKVLLTEAEYLVLEQGGYQVKTSHYADSGSPVIQVAIYDSRGQIKEEFVLAGEEKVNAVKYTYFADGRIESVNEGGYTTYYQYDVLGNITQLLEPIEEGTEDAFYRKTVYEYDRAGRQTKKSVYRSPVAWDSPALLAEDLQTDDTKYFYKNGLLVKEINPDGVPTAYTYDANGNIIEVTIGTGTIGKGTALKTKQGYDFRNNMTYKTQYLRAKDMDGKDTVSNKTVELTTTYNYDKEGRLKEEITPDGVKTVYHYDAAGNQTALEKVVPDATGEFVTEYRISTEYNTKGQKVSFTDALGNVTRYNYDNRGNLLSTEDALGGKSIAEYNYCNQIITEISPANYLPGQRTEKMSRTEYHYDEAGRLVEIAEYTMEDGLLINKAEKSYEYNQNSQVKKSINAEGYATEFGYKPTGELAYEISPTGNKTEYAYDVYGNLSQISNGINHVYYEYDFAGNLLETRDVHGIVERYTYDIFGNMVTYTDGNGHQTNYTYNALGEVASVTLPGDETIDELTTYYRYDTQGRVKNVYDTEGNSTQYFYDLLGNVTQTVIQDEETGDSIKISAEYDLNSREVAQTNAEGLRIERDYDELGRLIQQKVYTSSSEEKPKVTKYTYDANGNVLSETDCFGNVITKEYDAWNRLTKEYDALGHLIGAYTYDDIGNQKTAVDALGNRTSYEYDGVGNLISVKDAMGAESKTTYDAAGNVISITDALGHTNRYRYDGRNRLISATTPTGATVVYYYDNAGNLLVQKDGKGNQTIYEYNVRNLEVTRKTAGAKQQDLSMPKETRSYRADGSIKEIIDRNGVSTVYQYDAFGRMTEENAGGDVKRYTYDMAGNVLTMANGEEVIERSYDLENRVVSKSVSNVGTVLYSYDIPLEKGEHSEIMTTPDGITTTTVYDAVGRIREVSDSTGNTVYYIYNDNGSKQATVYADGTREDYSYDAAQRIVQVKHTDSYGAVLDCYEYRYDAVGNLIEEVSNRGTITYTYDADDRLKSVTEPDGRKITYSYDLAGNRQTMETKYGEEQVEKRAYIYDERNCLLSEKVDGEIRCLYEYDANGNLLKKVTENKETSVATGGALSPGGKTETATGGALKIPGETKPATGSALTTHPEIRTENTTGSTVETFTYDNYNRLRSYESSGVFAEYGYNAEDYRCYKGVQKDDFLEQTYYFYEGSRVIMEADPQGTITARNMYGTHLAARTVQDQSCYYLYNAHGDVVLLTDAVTGELVGTYQYDAFGTLVQATGNMDNNITYAGYQYDEESGLYYVNARYYDSTVARFLTEDTYRGRMYDPLSLNLYTYCHNNPLRYTDPSGHGFFTALAGKFLVSGLINAGIELINQKVIQKQEKVNWKAVAYEFVAGGVEGVVGGGTATKAIRKLTGKVVKETVEYGIKKTTKNIVKAVTQEAVSGFVNDVGRQIFVEDKELKEVDYGQAMEAAAISGVAGGMQQMASEVATVAVGVFKPTKVMDDISVPAKKTVDMPETKAMSKAAVPDMPKTGKKTGVGLDGISGSTKTTVDLPETSVRPKAKTSELPLTNTKAKPVLNDMADNVPSGYRKDANGRWNRPNGVKSGSKTVPESLLQGDANTRVYVGIKDGKPDYVGIAYDIERRQSQHGERFDYLRELTTEPLTRRQARAIEQAMINSNPKFSNKINSISTKRDWYNDAITWGDAWLKQHGYLK